VKVADPVLCEDPEIARVEADLAAVSEDLAQAEAELAEAAALLRVFTRRMTGCWRRCSRNLTRSRRGSFMIRVNEAYERGDADLLGLGPPLFGAGSRGLMLRSAGWTRWPGNCGHGSGSAGRCLPT
jgi:hypothetical protein